MMDNLCAKSTMRVKSKDSFSALLDILLSIWISNLVDIS